MYNQYLERYAEAEARSVLAMAAPRRWEKALVIPAYRENPARARAIESLAQRWPRLLVIVVLNRPETEQDSRCNQPFREALLTRHTAVDFNIGQLLSLPNGSEILLTERAAPLPAKEGVGLARKIGGDIALALIACGSVSGDCIHNTDADAELPDDHFFRPGAHPAAAAVVHPFRHSPPQDAAIALAARLYDASLRQYVDGLARAGSPYAFHTVGSCISVRAGAYAAVRGFPRRAAGEDFYLLNKVAKVGPVETRRGKPVVLEARLSDRVPFGTGPGILRIAEQDNPVAAPLFYHPAVFDNLRTLLAALPALATGADLDSLAWSCPAAPGLLRGVGIDRALAHCATHARDEAAWVRHFHQWFDGFRTLRFIHRLRDAGLANVCLSEAGLSGLEQEPPDVLQGAGKRGHETSAIGAVDHPVVVGE